MQMFLEERGGLESMSDDAIRLLIATFFFCVAAGLYLRRSRIEPRFRFEIGLTAAWVTILGTFLVALTLWPD